MKTVFAKLTGVEGVGVGVTAGAGELLPPPQARRVAKRKLAAKDERSPTGRRSNRFSIRRKTVTPGAEVTPISSR
jgi:hypothetical protein